MLKRLDRKKIYFLHANILLRISNQGTKLDRRVGLLHRDGYRDGGLRRRLLLPGGHGFWCAYMDDHTRNRMRNFWPGIVSAGGDEPTEESRRTRRRMMVQAKMHDPRDGGPDAEPL